MEHCNALYAQVQCPNSPYNPSTWQDQLDKTGLAKKYPNLVTSLARGFNAGIPKILHTFVPFNRISQPLHEQALQKHLKKEFTCNRYLGPFSQAEVEDLLGPFQSSPLSFIPKSNSDDFRGITDFSHPRSLVDPLLPEPLVASINSRICVEDFQCTWGTFNTFELLVVHLPPGCQASCRDISDAYRTIPLAPDQWPGTVVRISDNDQFAINTANAFGLVSGGGVFGHLADALVDILRAHGIGPITKWVDDFCLIRLPRSALTSYNLYRQQCHKSIDRAGGTQRERARIFYPGRTLPDGSHEEFDDDMVSPLRDLQRNQSSQMLDTPVFAYDDAHIDAITNPLGVHWVAAKHLPWTFKPVYLGFEWDLQARTVALPGAKKAKYLQALREWQAQDQHTLEEVEALHGKLVHVSLVVYPGPARLTALESMLARTVHSLHGTRPAPKYAPAQLEWWIQRLSRPFVGRAFHSYSPHADFAAYSDASSSVGIGLVIGDTWCAYRLR